MRLRRFDPGTGTVTGPGLVHSEEDLQTGLGVGRRMEGPAGGAWPQRAKAAKLSTFLALVRAMGAVRSNVVATAPRLCAAVTKERTSQSFQKVIENQAMKRSREAKATAPAPG